jgi:hypothetical protein
MAGTLDADQVPARPAAPRRPLRRFVGSKYNRPLWE